MDFFKTPHIQIQLLGKDPVFKYEFLVLFIYPCSEQSATYLKKVIYMLNSDLHIFYNVPHHRPVISSVIQVKKPVQKAAYKL